MTGTVLAISARLCRHRRAAAQHGPHLAVRVVGEGDGHRGDLRLLHRGVLLDQEPARLARHRSSCRRGSNCCGPGWSSPTRRSAIPARSISGSRNSTRTTCRAACRAPTGIRYTPPLAERSLKARDEIMAGNPQEGTANDMEAEESRPKRRAAGRAAQRPEPKRPRDGQYRPRHAGQAGPAGRVQAAVRPRAARRNRAARGAMRPFPTAVSPACRASSTTGALGLSNTDGTGVTGLPGQAGQ